MCMGLKADYSALYSYEEYEVMPQSSRINYEHSYLGNIFYGISSHPKYLSL